MKRLFMTQNHFNNAPDGVQEHATYILGLISTYNLCQCVVICEDDYTLE